MNGAPGIAVCSESCAGQLGGTKIEEFGVAVPGQGIGRPFFTAILDRVAAEQRPLPLWLAVAADNAGAIRFYERFGFVRKDLKPGVWHRRQGPVADALRMVLEPS